MKKIDLDLDLDQATKRLHSLALETANKIVDEWSVLKEKIIRSKELSIKEKNRLLGFIRGQIEKAIERQEEVQKIVEEDNNG